MQGPDRPIPIRPGRLTHWPNGYERQHLERQVRHFTNAVSAGLGLRWNFRKGQPRSSRRDKKANFMAKLQAELLHHELAWHPRTQRVQKSKWTYGKFATTGEAPTRETADRLKIDYETLLRYKRAGEQGPFVEGRDFSSLALARRNCFGIVPKQNNPCGHGTGKPPKLVSAEIPLHKRTERRPP